MTGCIARTFAKLGTVAVAALGVLGATALPATADTTDTTATSTEPTVTTVRPGTAPVAITADYKCTITADYGWRWEGNCRIASGELRTITYCANGTSSTGLWIGARPEPWAVWGNCPNSSWTRIRFESRG
ncbi:hypothetical protein ACFP3U_10460 [Kitasatospora misakiensis]|uniref:Uncharacterized protein n=1 Tax=Kitasatospora misakiensis TaxID=67330 RepID=A0ABW0X2H9_9ACTN